MAAGPSLPRRVQLRLEELYRLDPQPSVDDFVRPCADDEREQVLVRDEGDGVAIAVLLPAAGLAPGPEPLPLDPLCQVIEGVSHFVYLADRIAHDRPTTQLELELQAEVDKFAVLALEQPAAPPHGPFALGTHAAPGGGQALHRALYEGWRYLHDAGSEQGERYRLATSLAARFWAGLGATGRPAPAGGGEATVRRLRDFHRAGQADKIRLARAA